MRGQSPPGNQRKLETRPAATSHTWLFPFVTTVQHSQSPFCLAQATARVPSGHLWLPAPVMAHIHHHKKFHPTALVNPLPPGEPKHSTKTCPRHRGLLVFPPTPPEPGPSGLRASFSHGLPPCHRGHARPGGSLWGASWALCSDDWHPQLPLTRCQTPPLVITTKSSPNDPWVDNHCSKQQQPNFGVRRDLRGSRRVSRDWDSHLAGGPRGSGTA